MQRPYMWSKTKALDRRALRAAMYGMSGGEGDMPSFHVCAEGRQAAAAGSMYVHEVPVALHMR